MTAINVTRANFKDKLPQILKDVDRANFIAVDCEFSGLQSTASSSRWFYDDPNEYYTKNRADIKNLQVLQTGLTMSFYNPHLNSYTSTTYSFSLWPSVYLDSCRYITFENASVQFLLENNFDFSQCFHDGISFMSRYEYRKYRQLLSLFKQEPQSIINVFKTYKIQSTYPSIKYNIDEWLKSNKNESTFLLTPPYKDECYLTALLMHLILDYTKIAYPTICNQQILMTRSSTDWFNEPQTHTQLNILLTSVYGFTQVIERMIEKQKILVGHNLFLDLMYIYDKFISPLPSTLDDFKHQFTQIFPTIYDTKLMIKYEKQHDSTFLQLKYTSLMCCYTFFDMKYKESLLNFPLLPSPLSTTNPHDAGFDSYATSFVFLCLMHTISLPTKNLMKAKFDFNSTIALSEKYKNMCNLYGIHHSTLHLNQQTSFPTPPTTITRVVFLPSSHHPLHDIILLTVRNYEGHVKEETTYFTIKDSEQKILEFEKRLQQLGVRTYSTYFAYMHSIVNTCIAACRPTSLKMAIGMVILSAIIMKYKY